MKALIIDVNKHTHTLGNVPDKNKFKKYRRWIFKESELITVCRDGKKIWECTATSQLLAPPIFRDGGKTQCNILFSFRGHLIASRLNCHYDGIQPGFGEPDLMQFTDNVTHSTTYGNSYEEVREKLEKIRKEFEEAKG